MRRKRWLLMGAIIVAIMVAPIAWYLISPLFITRTVDEDFPVAEAAAASAETAMAASTVEQPTATAVPTTPAPAASPTATRPSETMPVGGSDGAAYGEAMPMSEAMDSKTAEARAEKPASAMAEVTPTAPAPQPAPEPTASAGPVKLISGQFHDVEHRGSGTATIYRLEDGKQVLRIESLDLLNGPDLYVWLSAASDAQDNRTILEAPYVELGRLKGNKGNQNYELPASLDVSQYHSVTIWCRQFSVNFATAPLR